MKNKQATSLHGILIILAAVMPVMAIVTLVPVLPMLQQEFSHVPNSEFLVPIALTIPALCLALFSPAAGWIADKTGRKNLLVISLLLYACLGTLPWFLTDLYMIITARIALGITEAAIMTVGTTLIGDYFEGSKRERWMAIQVATIGVAAVILVWLGGMLGGALGSRGPFLLYLVAVPVALASQAFLFEPKPDNNNTATEKSPLPVKDLLPLIVGGFVFGILFYIVIVQQGAILALKTSITPQLVGQMSAITNITLMIGTFAFGLLKKRASRPSLLSIGSLMIVAGYVSIPLATSVPMTVAACALVTFAAGILLPTFLTWVMSLLPFEVRGRGVGMWQGAFFLGQFVAPIFSVALSKATGGLENAFYFVSVIAAALAFFGFIRTRREALLAKQTR